MTARSRRLVSFAMTLLGAGLFAWVLARGGGPTLVEVVGRVGAAWPLLLVPLSINALTLLFAYRVSLPDRGRAVPLRVLAHVQRSGTVLSSLLPLANYGGNIVKVALLRRWYSTDEIVAAGVWGALTTGVCNVLGAIGPLACLASGYAEPWVAILLACVNVLMAAPAIAVLLSIRRGLAKRVTQLVARLPARLIGRRRERMLAWAERLDRHLAAAVGARRRDFAWLMLAKASAQTVRILEIWLALELVGLPGGLFAATLYNALSRIVTQVFSFVPGRLGILEIGAMAGFAALGLTAEAGLQLTLVLRFRYVVNMLVSAGALATSPSVLRKYPPLAEGVERPR